MGHPKPGREDNVRRMPATVSLSETALSVAPGATASCAVRVRNTGSVVEQFSFEVIGDTVPWATVTPPTLSLFPGADGEVTLSFAPPRSSAVAAGTVAFGVKVTSQSDPDWSAVEEGGLAVSPFMDTAAELIPRTSEGSRRGSHELAVDNRGNVLVEATLSGEEPDGRLDFDFDPRSLAVQAGTSSPVKLRVRPLKRFLLGPPRRHQFNVLVLPKDGAPVSLAGVYVQRARLPKWLPKAILAVLALLILLVVLWFAVLKPAVRSAARQAVEAPLAKQQAQLNNVAKKVGGGAGAGGAGSGALGAGGTGAGGGTGSTLSVLGNPTDGRVEVTASAHNSPAAASFFSVPSGKTVSITDLVLENPQGDSGTLTIRRNDVTLLSVQLANFRDLDYHFVAPLVFTGGQQFVVSLSCDTPGAPATNCADAVTFAGYKI